MGDELITKHGSFEKADRLQIERNSMGDRPQLGKYGNSNSGPPAISSQVFEMCDTGIDLEYVNGEAPIPRRSGLPYDAGDSPDILNMSRPLISSGAMFAASNHAKLSTTRIHPVHSAVVYKKMPGRSNPADFRFISDIRKANLGASVPNPGRSIHR